MTSNSVPLPSILQEFIDAIQWTYAMTMPEWPHEYIVRDRVDENLFMMLVQHIRSQGYEAKFYQTNFTYYDYRGMVYWTMGAPIEETTIINRCKEEGSYENRLRNGTLPMTIRLKNEAEQCGACHLFMNHAHSVQIQSERWVARPGH